jgi:acyl carrier protein
MPPQLWQDEKFMPDSTRRARLLAVLKQVTSAPLPADDEESLFESGLLDSFALPDLVSALEQEFSLKVPDRDLNPRKFDSIARMEAYLDEHAA